MLDDRQAKILQAVIEEYIRTAEPVSSKTIAEQHVPAVSPATVRNDMMALTEAMFLLQPHTSAGRVPTEQAYRYYLDHMLQAERAQRIAKDLQQSIRDEINPEAVLRAAARAIVALSGETAFVASDEHGCHTSGLANLMRKPEFDDAGRRVELAEALDRVEGAIEDLLHKVHEGEVTAWIGRDNPLGAELASLVVRVRLPNGDIGMLGLFGPLRMRYSRNIGLLQEVKKLLDSSFDDV